LKYEDIELKYENLIDFLNYLKTCRNETYPFHVKTLLDDYYSSISNSFEILQLMKENTIKSIEPKDIPIQRTIKDINRNFGVEFEEIIERESNHKLYPKVFSYLLEYLFVNGTSQVNIFKAQAPFEEVDRMKNLFDHGKLIDLSNYKEVNVIATLIKQLFGELPTPILSFDLYDEFVNVPDGYEEKMKHFRNLIEKLPLVKKYCFEQILSLLHHVSLNSMKNKMDSDEIANCWGLNLLRHKSKDAGIISRDLTSINSSVSYMIKTYPILKEYFKYE
jgi:hypothetical protein